MIRFHRTRFGMALAAIGCAAALLGATPETAAQEQALTVSLGRLPWGALNSPITQHMMRTKGFEAEAAKQAGAQVRFTVYNGVGHNSWDRAYADPSLEEWMLAQRRR